VEGYLDELPREAVPRFEKGYLEYLDSNYADMLHTISTTRDIPPDAEDSLRRSVTKYIESSAAGKGS